jgi:hypothetical protein
MRVARQTLPPKWSASRRSESSTDRYAPHTSHTRSFWLPDAPDVSVSCWSSRWGCTYQRRLGRGDMKEKHTSLSAFSDLSASIACISRIDSSTLPCSPAECYT